MAKTTNERKTIIKTFRISPNELKQLTDQYGQNWSNIVRKAIGELKVNDYQIKDGHLIIQAKDLDGNAIS